MRMHSAWWTATRCVRVAFSNERSAKGTHELVIRLWLHYSGMDLTLPFLFPMSFPP